MPLYLLYNFGVLNRHSLFISVHCFQHQGYHRSITSNKLAFSLSLSHRTYKYTYKKTVLSFNPPFPLPPLSTLQRPASRPRPPDPWATSQSAAPTARTCTRPRTSPCPPRQSWQRCRCTAPAAARRFACAGSRARRASCAGRALGSGCWRHRRPRRASLWPKTETEMWIEIEIVGERGGPSKR